MHYPSRTAAQIAARVWCDQEMSGVVMDIEAAREIARILDAVREKQKVKEQQKKEAAPKAEDQHAKVGEVIERLWREKLAKQKQQAARLEPPPDLVRAIYSEPLVAAVWAEAERTGLTREEALTAVALELLADNVRYRRAEVERQMGWLRMPRAEATPVGPPAASHVASYFTGYASSPGVPTVVESAP